MARTRPARMAGARMFDEALFLLLVTYLNVLLAFACSHVNAMMLADFDLTIADRLVWLLQSRWGVPYLWVLSPSILFVWLMRDKPLECKPCGLLASGSIRRAWLRISTRSAGRGFVHGLVSASAALAVACSAGGRPVDFSEPGSLFALSTGSPAGESVPFWMIAGVALLVSAEVHAVLALAFRALSLLPGGDVLASCVLMLLGLPTSRGIITQSAGYLGRIADLLLLPYDVTGIDYATWTGGFHGLLLQPVLLMIVAMMGLLLFRRRCCR